MLSRYRRNAGKLFTSSVLASLLGMGAFALIARSLGPEQFGAFALIVAYAFVIDTLINFQSWQAIIKFGASDLERRDSTAFSSLIKFGTLLDVCCAAGSTLVAVAGAPFIARYLGLGEGAGGATVLACYSLVILSRVTGTATAMLRLFDRFGILAAQQALIAVARFAFVALIYFLAPGLSNFLIAWALCEVAGNLALVSSAWTLLRRRGYVQVMQANARAAPLLHPGLWTFVWSTNIQSTMKLGLREADVLALGLILDQSAAGLYKIVKQADTVASKAFGPLTQAVYPELAAAAAARDHARFRHIVRASAAFAAAIFGLVLIAVWLAGEPLIVAVLGAEFAAAYAPLLIYLFGTLVAAATLTLHPAVLALGMPQRSLGILSAATAVYAVAFGLLTYHYGLKGAAAAYVVFYVVWSVPMLILVRRGIRSLAAPVGCSHAPASK